MRVCLRQVTAPGASALAVLEVSGTEAEAFLRSLGVGDLPGPGGMRLARLDLGRQLREQALLVATGSGYEIQTHGNPLLIEAIQARVPSQARPDAHQETWDQHILRLARETRGRHALRLALFQLGPAGLSGLLRSLASGAHVDSNLRACRRALARAPEARACLRSPRIVLRGRVNSGKSTLFNLLLGRERVRTGPLPALTRDPVQEEILYRDRPLILVDTAGEADVLAQLDRTAESLAKEEGRTADLTLWLHSHLDGEAPVAGPLKQLVVETHHDHPDLEALHLDLLHGDRDAIRAQVLDRVIQALGLGDLPPLTAAPLDQRMEDELRWLLGQPDPEVAARSMQRLRTRG